MTETGQAQTTPVASRAPIEPSQPYGDIVNRLSRTLSAANRYLATLMQAEGIEGIVPSHGDILRQLFTHGAMPMALLADKIGKDPSTVTALVKKLAEGGYVTTRKNEHDRRVTEVELTDAGRKLDEGIRAVNAGLMDAVSEGLTERQLVEVCKVLEQMQRNFDARM